MRIHLVTSTFFGLFAAALPAVVAAGGLRSTNNVRVLPSTTSSSSSTTTTMNQDQDGGDCQQLVEMTVTETPIIISKKCHSHGFLYHGGSCPEGTSQDCWDILGHSSQQDEAGDQVYIVVADVSDSSVVYYQGHQQVGSFFQVISAGGGDESNTNGLPEVYNITIFPRSAMNPGETASFDTMLQTMLVRAPCGGSDDLLDALPISSSVQVVFTSQVPPVAQQDLLQYRVELWSQTSELWTLESLQASSSDLLLPLEEEFTTTSVTTTSFGRDLPSLQVSMEAATESFYDKKFSSGDKVLSVQVTAQVVSSSGRRCTIKKYALGLDVAVISTPI